MGLGVWGQGGNVWLQGPGGERDGAMGSSSGGLGGAGSPAVCALVGRDWGGMFPPDWCTGADDSCLLWAQGSLACATMMRYPLSTWQQWGCGTELWPLLLPGG